MANLKLIKELASAQNRTLEDLAASCGLGAQAIHLMVRSGSTKLETLEKIAKELNVPAYIFMDYGFDIEDYKRVVIRGHHNPTAFFGGSAVVQQGADPEMTEKLLKSKDDTISVQKMLIDNLKTEKERLQEEVDRLKAKYEPK